MQMFWGFQEGIISCSSKWKESKSKENLSLTSSGQDEEKVRSAGKEEKTRTGIKRKQFWKTKGQFWKTMGHFWEIKRHFWDKINTFGRKRATRGNKREFLENKRAILRIKESFGKEKDFIWGQGLSKPTLPPNPLSSGNFLMVQAKIFQKFSSMHYFSGVQLY